MFSFVSLGSGSKGNAFLLSDGETLLQVDMGRPREVLEAFLCAHQKQVKDIDALLITHTHFDHIGTVKTMDARSKKRGPKVYTGDKNYQEADCYLTPFETLIFGKIKVTPILASHDSPNTLGYIFEDEEESLAYLTDTGLIPPSDFSYLKNKTYFVLESNHDLMMLKASSRPAALKRRIRGNKGHLSNEKCASYLKELVGDKTKEIYLAHLSEECNKEEFALESTRRSLEELGRSDILLKAFRQYENVEGGHPWR